MESSFSIFFDVSLSSKSLILFSIFKFDETKISMPGGFSLLKLSNIFHSEIHLFFSNY